MRRHNVPRWVRYLRVSDEDKQSPERSFATQRRDIEDKLLKNSDLPFYREYCDLLTGSNPNRKDYQQMLADAEAGKFSHIAIYRSDRFGRDVAEGITAGKMLVGLGIKIRVASSPNLRPEEPDGFLLFQIQMGLAQHEVDVLRLRIAGGMETKLRAGGWAYKAPEGYINKERAISSNKYERWVEQDPRAIDGIKFAFELLLTDRYTMDQICEELAKNGYVRVSGRPWAWDDPKTGRRRTARNRLHQIFHNPFYAGWVVSERFEIKIGEVQGNWEPIITPDQFEHGKSILLKHGNNKMNFKKRFYLLRNLLWVRADE